MEIVNHRLKEVRYVESPNHGGSLNPDSIIIHFTAGSSLESAINTFKDPLRKVSAHLIVGRNGEVVQMVPFNVIGWHAGKSAYQGRTGFNKFAIGIEIVNAGMLTKRDNLYYAWFGTAYPASEVVFARHRNETLPKYWHRFTDVQIETVRELCRVILRTYNISLILGHEEISPDRKVDPGPAFPLDTMRAQLAGQPAPPGVPAPEPGVVPATGFVTASFLNIREFPSGSAELAARPLPRGTQVKVISQQGDWYRVSTEVEGWVAKRFIMGE